MESALSPNTAAFLQYISSQMGGNANAGNNDQNAQSQSASIDQQLATSTTSLPPSAFFQMPQPQTTNSNTNSLSTPASKSVSPVDTKPSISGAKDRSVSLSGSDEGSPLSLDNASGSRNAGAGIDHKRKAGGHHVIEEDGEDDGTRILLRRQSQGQSTDSMTETDSDAATGHEDKRQHQNTKTTKKGGRKSGVSANGEDGTSGKEMSKSARRKEQNRAAQKAFRERREARVTDVRLAPFFHLESISSDKM